MIIKRVKLQNIRSYTSLDLALPEGITLLWGDIGSGKSTVLHAIEFALFGVMREVSGSSLLRKGKKQGSVELTFNIDGKDIVIKRTLKQTKDAVAQDAGFLLIDGTKYDLTATELKSRILDMIGYPMEFATKSKYHLYRYTVYTPQEQMKRILQEDAEARLDTLRKVFNVDKYKRIAGNAEIIAKELRDNVRVKKSMLMDSAALEKECKQYQTKYAAAVLQQQQCEKESLRIATFVTACRQKAAEQEQQLNTLRELMLEHRSLDAQLEEKKKLEQQSRKQLDILLPQLKGTKEQVAALKGAEKHPDVAAIEKSVKETEASLTYHITQCAMLQERVTQFQREKAELEKTLAGKEKLGSDLLRKRTEHAAAIAAATGSEACKKAMEETARKVQDLKIRIGEQQMLITRSEALMEKVRTMDVCPTCMQEVDAEHKSHIQAAEDAAVQKAKKLLMDCTENCRQLEQQHAALVVQHERLQDMKMQAEKLGAEIAHLGKLQEEIGQQKLFLETIEKKFAATQQSLDVLQQRDTKAIEQQIAASRALLQQIHNAMHLMQLMQEREQHAAQLEIMLATLVHDQGELSKRTAELTEKLKGTEKTEKQWQETRAELEALQQKEKHCLVELAETRKEGEALMDRINDLMKKIEQQQQMKQQIEQVTGKEQWLSMFFVPLLGTMEKQVLFKIHQEFSVFFEQWFNVLIEDGNISVRLDDAFTPIIMQNGYETEMESLSGGEKTALALAYRLALNKVINALIADIKTKDLIILDEPTDGFSAEQLDKMHDVLVQLGMKQVIIVSHEAKMEAFANHVLQVQKHEHVSTIEK